MKYLVLALFMLAAGAALTQSDLGTQIYYPVVRLRTSDGFFITSVQERTSRRTACRESMEQFIEPIRRDCARCTLESAECVSDLVGVELALANGEVLDVHTVTAEGIKMALVGPPESAQKTCEAIAARIVLNGMKNASCVFPRRAASG